MHTTPAQKIETFFAAYPKRTFDKNTVLIHADENPHDVFFLIKGSVRQYDITHHGDEVVVNVVKVPAFFPMLYAVTRIPNNYYYETVTEVIARTAPINDVLEFVQSDSDVMYDLLTRLYIGVDALLKRMAHLMGGSAQSRLLFELIIASRQFGEYQEDGGYLIPLKETEIAARAGLTRETISRQMHRLKELNLVRITNKGIMVQNVASLEKRLGTKL